MFSEMQDVMREKYLESGKTLEASFRLAQLKKLEMVIQSNADAICNALFKDLRKPLQESMLGEVAFLLEEIRHVQKNLKNWMAPSSKWTPLVLQPAQSKVYYDPLGVVLIIGPWNYPFQLAIAPLIGALAAGNCAVVKPSELTPATSSLIAKLLGETFPPELVKVVEGGVAETTELLKLKWDYIFFTGSTPVGRIVMQAAAKTLSPVTLELGGKSPTLVTAKANLELAARRIVWGKFFNLGQTCVAPDFILAHRSVTQKLITHVKLEITKQFGQDAQKSRDLARIVNARNLQRLEKMLVTATVVHGGKVDAADLFIEPTLLYPVQWSDPVMDEEIFGPILPILEYEDFSEVLQVLNQRERPLAAYLFSEDKGEHEIFTQKLRFGGGTINDTMMHLSHPELPFGGVGESGIGHYHGHASFLCFSHQKSVLRRFGLLDVPMRYAPYSEAGLKLLRKFLRF